MPLNYHTRETPPSTKMRSSDRVFKLEAIDDKLPKTSHGIVDPNLLNGKNRLHAVMDEQTTLWTVKYEHGAVPPALASSWTSFSRLKDNAEGYFANRNIKITEVQD